jgi:EAL domain-containing protein (putative c-di-GMP-specific phosphodiesterase class I)
MINVNEFSIRTAILGDGVVAYAQPIVELTPSLVWNDSPSLSFEFLARLKVGNQMLSPGQFMPVVEQDPILMARLDQQVLLQAVWQLAYWKKALGLSVHGHVNASQVTLCDPSYSAYVEMLLHAYGVSPKQLTIEVLESCHQFWLNDQVLKTLASIATLTVGVAVDDVGPGWQNLPGLMAWIESSERYIPLSHVKIDQSLVKAAGAYDNVSVQQIIYCCEVAKARGIGVVAEGIERQDDLCLMQQLGCNFVQGYALGKPQSLETTTKSLQELYRDEVYSDISIVRESQEQVTAPH